MISCCDLISNGSALFCTFNKFASAPELQMTYMNSLRRLSVCLCVLSVRLIFCIVIANQVWYVNTQGGLIARALFTIPGFDVSSVHTIITQATPHRMPVIALDSYLVDFYDRVNSYWLYNSTGKLDSVTVLSTGGGYRDVQVRGGLTMLDEVMSLWITVWLM